MNIKIGISITLIILVALFLFQNTEVVDIRLLWWKISMSRALMIFVVLAIGLVAGWLLSSHSSRKRGNR